MIPRQWFVIAIAFAAGALFWALVGQKAYTVTSTLGPGVGGTS